MDELNKVINSGNPYFIMKTALLEIAKCEGAFSRDPHKHATNVIVSTQEIALAALVAVQALTVEEADEKRLG